MQGRSGGGTQPPELCWDHDGVEALRGVLGAELLEELRAFLGDLEADAAGRGEIALHHHEQTDSGPALARSERFADTHGGLGRFVLGQAADMVAEVAGEEVVLFKEKVNYKQPGGAGFAPHQDARAYRFTDYHVSLMVPLDPATLESGCLWFAPNPGRGLLADDGRGRIAEWLAETLEWQPVEVQPGDVVVFDSRAPHRSGTNRSTRPRRAMYLTYNRAAEGDLRQRYYRDKEAEFATADGTFGGERARISISDDFLGRPLEHPGVAVPSGGEASPGDPSSPGGGAAEVLAGMYASPRAQELYDEHVTELAHGLQAAALAEAEGAPADLVAAALLHDVGHLLVGDLVPIDEELVGDARHEAAGARFLRRWFPASVTAPVALHVAAKRYLCAVEPGYAAALSPSSVRSMGVQGGPMSPAEVSDFEARPHHEAAVAMRRWDDLAKVEGLEVPGFDHYVGLLLRLATSGP